VVLTTILVLVASGCGGRKNSAQTAKEPTRVAATPLPYEGGEKSIEDFGVEAEGSDRMALFGTFHSYLEALAAKDYETACTRLIARVHHSLERLAGKIGRDDCAAILPRLLAPTAATIARQQAGGHVTKIRVEGDRAFVVFHAPGARLYQFSLNKEGGEWGLTTVSASILSPSKAALGQ
jgi:hypothetical protein